VPFGEPAETRTPTMKRFLMIVSSLAMLSFAVRPAAGAAIPGGLAAPSGTPGVGGSPDPFLSFAFVDSSGDVGFGSLNAINSGLGDGSLWAVSGSLTMTGGALAGDNFSLLGAGPGVTAIGSTNPGIGWVVDNLVYLNDDAGNSVNNGQGGLASISNPSYLTNGGLLFGSGSTEVNIFGNGNGDYAFLYTTPSGFFGPASGGKFVAAAVVPEPSSLTLLGLSALGMVGYTWRRRKVAARRNVSVR
jgi:hypothetical protein